MSRVCGVGMGIGMGMGGGGRGDEAKLPKLKGIWNASLLFAKLA